MKVAIRAVACATAFSLLGGVAVDASTLNRKARRATRYIVNSQAQDGSIGAFSQIGTTSDAILALVAAERGPGAIEAALDYLRAHVAQRESLGQTAKIVMAVVAAGEDPRDFGNVDLVQEILDSEQPDGQYGQHTPEDAFDGEVTNHALSILALAAVAESHLSTNSLTWLISAQCGDGGWQHTGPQGEDEGNHCFTGDPAVDPFMSDTNTTSYAVQAVAAHPSIAPYRENPARFFRRIRDPRKGGWGYTWGFRLTDANSTALALQALRALGVTEPDGAMRALKRLQYGWCGENAGAFAFTWAENDNGKLRRTGPDVGATVGAVLGLFRARLPIEGFPVTQEPPSAPAC